MFIYKRNVAECDGTSMLDVKDLILEEVLDVLEIRKRQCHGPGQIGNDEKFPTHGKVSNHM